VTPGRCRRASVADSEVLAAWMGAFAAEVGEPLSLPSRLVVEHRIAAGQLWIWEDGGRPVAFLGLTDPVSGAVRVGPVFTPPRMRGRGYASALVAERSAAVRATGDHCLLYADLTNPTSNGVYRALGYRAVAETLRYEFAPSA
jgi:predicted GNAT family acetyltransferase